MGCVGSRMGPLSVTSSVLSCNSLLYLVPKPHSLGWRKPGGIVSESADTDRSEIHTFSLLSCGTVIGVGGFPWLFARERG